MTKDIFQKSAVEKKKLMKMLKLRGISTRIYFESFFFFQSNPELNSGGKKFK